MNANRHAPHGLTLLLFVLLVAALRPAAADLIRSSPQTPSQGPDELRARVEARLLESGLTAAEARERLDALPEEDVRALAENPDQVQLAGGIGLGIYLLAAGILLFVFLWLLGTEKIKL